MTHQPHAPDGPPSHGEATDIDLPPLPPVPLVDRLADDHALRAFAGALVADAVAMPVHWYYDSRALDHDYPELIAAVAAPDAPPYLAPRHPHTGSILWRSHWTPSSPDFDILRDQARYWGQRDVHYHQFLAAGDNTLNARLAVELYALARRDRDYDPERWLDRYVRLMLEPGWNRDTYVEEYHRHFFTNLGHGRKPINCGVRDVHIGGLVAVPALVAALGPRHHDLRRIVRLHVSLTHKDDEVLAAADALVRLLVRLTREDLADARPPGSVEAAAELREALLEEAPDWISAAKVRAWQRACDEAGGGCPERAVVGGMLSPACYIPDAFPAALFLAWRHAGDIAGGARANALCGGDNCHRGAVVGAVLGAAAPIPAAWLTALRANDTLANPQGHTAALPPAARGGSCSKESR
jgi:ADP-ribosyl-[dinitrogen reductase] hydrolase